MSNVVLAGQLHAQLNPHNLEERENEFWRKNWQTATLSLHIFFLLISTSHLSIGLPKDSAYIE